MATLQSSPPISGSSIPVAHCTSPSLSSSGGGSIVSGLGDSGSQPIQASSWRTSLIRERIQWARRFRTLIVDNADELVALIQAETHKPAFEAFAADILALISACKWHERHSRRLLGPHRIAGRPAWLPGIRSVQTREPLGRVAIIATWNYPIQLLGIQLVQAIMAGNDVVVKPSERTPRSQARLVELARQSGLPSGALELRPAAREAGQQMLESERFDHIIFTGSTRVGHHIALAAAETLTPTTLELSGCDSALVFADADARLAARVIWNAVTMNSGQTCMAPRRVLVHRDVYAAFLAALAPLAAGARLLRLIDDSAAALTFELARESVARGARSLSGVLESPKGAFLRTLAVVDCPPDAPLATTEHFGPALAVVPLATDADMLAVHARVDQKLVTSVFTRSNARAHALTAQLGSSIVSINDAVLPAGHPGITLAGHGASGWGASRGRDGLLSMTRSVTITSTSGLFRTPPETPNAAVAANITRFMKWWYR